VVRDHDKDLLRKLPHPIGGARIWLAHTDALIVDLRRNGGGDPESSKRA
jgi:hypothetical protein